MDTSFSSASIKKVKTNLENTAFSLQSLISSRLIHNIYLVEYKQEGYVKKIVSLLSLATAIAQGKENKFILRKQYMTFFFYPF